MNVAHLFTYCRRERETLAPEVCITTLGLFVHFPLPQCNLTIARFYNNCTFFNPLHWYFHIFHIPSSALHEQQLQQSVHSYHYHASVRPSPPPHGHSPSRIISLKNRESQADPEPNPAGPVARRRRQRQWLTHPPTSLDGSLVLPPHALVSLMTQKSQKQRLQSFPLLHATGVPVTVCTDTSNVLIPG